jgi:hypothetical protein
MSEVGAAAAISPTSNLFLGSGFFDYAASDAAALKYGLASDVGGGTSFSPFHTMHAAYTVARQSAGRPGISLAPEHLWWQHTAGAAAALDLAGTVGNLLPGCEADFVALNPQATPLLARRTAQTETLAEWLFAMIVLGDERLIACTVVQGQAAPVAARSRAAALPVGAARWMRAPGSRSSTAASMAATVLVLPVPGPPSSSTSPCRSTASTVPAACHSRPIPRIASKSAPAKAGWPKRWSSRK